jgi:hypothetical protein
VDSSASYILGYTDRDIQAMCNAWNEHIGSGTPTAQQLQNYSKAISGISTATGSKVFRGTEFT